MERSKNQQVNILKDTNEINHAEKNIILEKTKIDSTKLKNHSLHKN